MTTQGRLNALRDAIELAISDLDCGVPDFQSDVLLVTTRALRDALEDDARHADTASDIILTTVDESAVKAGAKPLRRPKRPGKKGH